ncbi:MAG: DNA repair protein RadA, partial [Porticoccaceae bacterium]|nr:DNA repair protein RadA [Porticoccaceae bacterium]
MAKKPSTAYVCNECGADFAKWQGQCGECGAWNSLSEVRLGAVKAGRGRRSGGGFAGAADGAIKVLADIAVDEVPRIPSGSAELDLVLGG